jgi:hypothetical protein
VTGCWRKLDNELHNFYCSPNTIKMKSRLMMGRACRAHWKKRNAIILVGKPEEKSLLDRLTIRPGLARTVLGF